MPGGEYPSMPATARSAGARPRRRTLAPAAVLACLLVLLCGLAYLLARETSLFALRSVDVRGTDPRGAEAVRGALGPLLGTSLVALSADDAERAAESVPAIRSATIDRRFPNGLLVSVVPERPVAVVRQGEDDGWLVSATGRVLAPVERGAREELARVWLPVEEEPPLVGHRLTDAQGAAAVRTIAQVPASFPERVLGAHGTPSDMTLVLSGKLELRLGELDDVKRKLASAAAVLRTLAREEAAPLGYLDVTVPARPVGGEKSQLESDA